MKILQTIAGFGAHSGGTSTCTYNLLSAMHRLVPEPCVDLLAPEVARSGDRLMGNGEQWIRTVPNDCVTPMGISRNMSRFLRENDFDIYHTNGMWMHINHMTCAIARKRHKPYVITPHGMLYPEALVRSAWKKRPLRALWFDRDVREASCVHVTCADEMKYIRNLGYRGPVALIGNPVAAPWYAADIFSARLCRVEPLWGVAFLGRLHPIKKVENLLYGVAQCAHAGVRVFVVGTGDSGYERFLHSEVERLGIANRVDFLGFLSGRDKFEQLARVDALFVPSDMENFGMIVPEALIVGTPVMASLGTPWEALNTERCGWWCDNSPESIANVINELYSMSNCERQAMGRRGRDYILHMFAADKVAGQMLALYRWLNGDDDKPEFVYE